MSTRNSLLEALGTKAGPVISGEILARRLGVSRTAVWKQMRSLRHAGIPVEAMGRRGYRLEVPFDNSLAMFKSVYGYDAHYFLNTASTQSLAKAGAESGLPANHLWIAETQSKGRGRFNRVWESNFGGLWFSILLRPKLAPARVTALTLVAGLCLQKAVELSCGVGARLKWPNDLVVQLKGTWKKCAGILTELSGQVERTDWVVLGVGLNVNNAVSTELQAASISEVTGKIWVRGKILESFLRLFRDACEDYDRAGFEPFRKRYWANYFAPGQTVCLRTAQGDLRGLALGVDAAGALLIGSRRKYQPVREGEIVLIR